MHPRALPSCFLLETRALPADAERVVYSVAFDAHDPPAGRAANRNRVRAEAIAYVLRPDDVLNCAPSDLREPAALGTGDHGTCLAAKCAWVLTADIPVRGAGFLIDDRVVAPSAPSVRLRAS